MTITDLTKFPAEYTLHLGDCLIVMPTLAENSVDSIVTDPPYGISFMSKHWDHGVPGVDFWREALRVAKPGAHLLAFGGDRTHHRLMVAIEDAGWEIRTCVYWCYGSGFKKGADVGKDIDKRAGAVREVVGEYDSRSNYDGNKRSSSGVSAGQVFNGKTYGPTDITAPATDAARQWDGWHSGLKPAVEIIVVARKPLIGTIAENVMRWGTGALNIDASRVGTTKNVPASPSRRGQWFGGNKEDGSEDGFNPNIGRWPATLIHDGSPAVTALFPVTTSGDKAHHRGLQQSGRHGGIAESGASPKDGTNTVRGHDDTGGSAAHFFQCCPFDADDLGPPIIYVPKASRRDRNDGIEEGEERAVTAYGDFNGTPEHAPNTNSAPRLNHHATVKPRTLMRYLVRLVTQPGGTVLDPFSGSGSTGVAALIEGMRYIGIEQDASYHAIAQERVATAANPLRAMMQDDEVL